jgi:hypothetical protein
MKNILQASATALAPLVLALLAAGCPSDPVVNDAGNTDAPPPNDAFIEITNDCAGYCTQTMTNCTGDNAQYADMADCLAQCDALDWPEGTPGSTDGNTIACRIYHGGAPAQMDPAVHCSHAGPTGDGVCGAAVTFRTEAAMTATRVDRMGMPAVSTALISSGMKNGYNDANPSNDAALEFAVDALTSLGGLHMALDDDLTGAGLAPCSMTETQMLPGIPVPVPNCAAQEVAPGVPVVSLIVPDTLRIDPTAPTGFPNGRDLDDPVIDVTLAVILLDLTSTDGCAGGACTPATLAGLPLNPSANAAGEILDTFPYFGQPTAP